MAKFKPNWEKGAILLSCCLLMRLALTAPCPSETPMYGGAILDGSADEYEQYFVVDDDDLTRVTSFSYCVCCINPDTGEHEHFRGFSATIHSPTTGFQTQDFGVMYGTDDDTYCETHDMSNEELMRLTIYADFNDAEGIVWYGHEGSVWESRANGPISFNDQFMLGRPIGFRVIMGHGGMPNQPLLISVLYNSCNCPASTFIDKYPMTNMENTAVTGPVIDQAIQYQPDYMASIYGQDCGSYKISYSPTLPFFEIQETGSTLDYLSRPYPDLARLSTATLDDIGQYTVTISVYQDIDDVEDGFETPFRGVIPSLEYDITLTINPCEASSVAATTLQGDITYRLGDPGLSQGTYAFSDSPNACGFDQTISLSGLPAFVTHDEVNKEFAISEILDASLIGAYPVTITCSIQVPTDFTKTTFTEVTAEQTFTIYIEPCQVTSVNTLSAISNIFWAIGDPSVTRTYAFQQSPDCKYALTYSLTSVATFISHDTALNEITLEQSSDTNLIGSYLVTVEATATMFDDYTKATTSTVTNSFSFTIFVDPCLVFSYTIAVKVVEIRQILYAPALTDGYYEFKETPACGYPETVTLTNLPAIATHNEAASDFTLAQTSDVADLGTFTVNIESSICVPTDYTMASCNTLSVNYDFLVIVEKCEITDYLPLVKVTELRYNIGAVDLTDGFYDFEETPNCGYPETVSLTNLPAFVTHNDAASDFTIPLNSDLSLIGEYTVNIESSICVPDDATTCTPMSADYDFKVYIEPCLVTTYSETVIAGPITYRVGDPALTDGIYEFTESPVCGYPEAVSFSNLPAWVTHNPGSSDFTIPQTGDLSLIGEHVVTISSHIDIPDDYSKTTFTPMVASYDFSIFVEPCVVTDLTVTPIAGPVQYTIGEVSMTSPQYTFTQVPNCGYDLSVSVAGLESFITHQTSSYDFVIPQTVDLALEGIYDLTVDGSISTPDDYTKNTFTTVANSFTFQVEMIDPCQASVIDSPSIENMQRSILQDLVTQSVDPSADSMSLMYGAMDGLSYCGPRILEITTDPALYSAFLSFDPDTDQLTLGSNDSNDIGIYTIEARTYLENYPSVEASVTFTVTINPCVVTAYTDTVRVVEIRQILYAPALTDGYYEFEQTPACGYPESVTLTNLPTIATHNEAASDFTLAQISDFADLGDYTVTIESSICVPTDYTYASCTAISASYDFLIVVERCEITDYLPLVKVTELRYNIGAVDLTDGFYDFEETPNCGYPETVSLTNLPAFVTHNDAASDFTIPLNSDLSLIGEYTVNIESSICVPDDATTCTPMSADYDFKVYIEPCLVTTYSETVIAGPITYRVGDPALTDGIYEFTESPVCGYPEAVSFSNLPAWVTHNPGSSDFTIPQTGDLSLIGEHVVTISSQIDIPDDYSKTTFTPIVASYDFSIFVEPCVVTDLTVTPIAGPVQYTIGEVSMTSPQYTFTQVPNCGYDLSVSVAGLESFITHQTSSYDFVIPQTVDLALEGIYDLTVDGSISMPDDYTKNTFTTVANSFTFQVEMIDPCQASVIDSPLIADMVRTVLQAPDSQVVADSFDSMSLMYGSMDGLSYCGLRVLEITTDPALYSAFLSFDSMTNTLTLGSTDINDVGVYTVEARTYLESYSSVEASVTFTVTINYCVVTDMQQEVVSTQFYNVHAPAHVFSAQTFTLTPTCGYDLDYVIRLKDPSTGAYSPLPTWIANTSGLELSVQTEDNTNIGIYEISIIGSVPLMYMDQTYQEELIIVLNVEDGCKLDEVSPVSTIDDQLYYIAEDGTVSLTPVWSTKIFGCPVLNGISVVESDGTERALNASELAVISQDPDSGEVSILTSDYALDGQIWPLKVYRSSIYSLNPNREGAVFFDVEFRDICWDSDIQEANFASPAYSFVLYEMQSMLFTEMVDLSQGPGYCGGYTTELEYVAGPVLDLSFTQGADLSTYSIVAQADGLSYAIEGTVSLKSWLGTHTLRLKSTLGTFDPSPTARGNNGLYNSVTTSFTSLLIQDPCLVSVVNADQGVTFTDMLIEKGELQISATYSGPTNSVSVQYGNGYNRCGPYTYSVEGTSSLRGIFTTEIEQIDDDVDSLKLILNSEKSGTKMNMSVTILIELAEYPSATPSEQVIEIEYYECFPANFVGPPIDDQLIMVGDSGFSIDLPFDQSPCEYQQTYEVVVFDKETGRQIEIPVFIDIQGGVVVIDVPAGNDVGNYEIQVCSSLNNSLKTTACSTFDLQVVPQPAPDVYILVPIEPDFMVRLVDQKVKVGEDLIYSPGDNIGVYGQEMKVQVQLLNAFQFMTFDAESNSFYVDGSLTTPDDIGDYPIKVRATFFNETFSESYTRTFMLKIWDANADKADDEEAQEAWFPPDPIFYHQWKPDRIKRFNNTQVEDKDRPIPYIVGLSIDGVLKIGWNKTMKPPQNATEIPPTQIAIEEGLNLNDYRFYESRRWLQPYSKFQVDLDDQTLVYFADNDKTWFERMQLIDALEVLITPVSDEATKVEFTWDVVGYNKDNIWLQLVFQNPQDLAADGTQYDTLTVTFWGVEYFKSTQGKEVRFGTTLHWPIMRQISLKDKEAVDTIDSVLRLITIGSFLLLLPVIFAGSLLPTWMFINALQIVAHLALLKTTMPANAHYFLKRYLDWLRWYDQEFVDWLQLSFDFKSYELGEGAYHVLLQLAGYSHLFAQNMIIVICVLLIILTVLMASIIKDLVKHACKREKSSKVTKRHSPWCCNFTLRFFYEFFLEFCICIFLQLTVVDFSTFSPSFQFILSIALAVAIFGLVLFIVSRFVSKGPWIPAFYAKTTSSLQSIHQVRQRDPDFDYDKYLSEHPIAEMKPWGTIIINFDLDQARDRLCCRRRNKSQVSCERVEKTDFEDVLETERRLLKTVGNDEIVINDIFDERNIQKLTAGGIDGSIEGETLEVDDNINIKNSCKTEREAEHNSQIMNNTENFYEKSRDNIDEFCEGGGSCEVESDKKDEAQEMLIRNDTSPNRVVTTQVLSPPRVSSPGAQSQNQTLRDQKYASAKSAGEAMITSFYSQKSLLLHQLVLQRRETVKMMQKEAKQRVMLEDTVKPSQSYKTLYYGLKLNHERNVAVVHPLMFLLRRIIYALVIVFMDEVMVWGVYIVMTCCLIMLAYALSENQWKESLINQQHVVNEILIYVLCVNLLLFSGYVSAAMRQLLGFVMIAICFLFVTYNTIIIVMYSLRLLWKYLRRVIYQRHLLKIQMRLLKIANKAPKILSKKKSKTQSAQLIQIQDFDTLEEQNNSDKEEKAQCFSRDGEELENSQLISNKISVRRQKEVLEETTPVENPQLESTKKIEERKSHGDVLLKPSSFLLNHHQANDGDSSQQASRSYFRPSEISIEYFKGLHKNTSGDSTVQDSGSKQFNASSSNAMKDLFSGRPSSLPPPSPFVKDVQNYLDSIDDEGVGSSQNGPTNFNSAAASLSNIEEQQENEREMAKTPVNVQGPGHVGKESVAKSPTTKAKGSGHIGRESAVEKTQTKDQNSTMIFIDTTNKAAATSLLITEEDRDNETPRVSNFDHRKNLVLLKNKLALQKKSKNGGFQNKLAIVNTVKELNSYQKSQKSSPMSISSGLVSDSDKENGENGLKSKDRRSRQGHHSQAQSKCEQERGREITADEKNRRSRLNLHESAQPKFEQELDREIVADEKNRQSRLTDHAPSQTKFESRPISNVDKEIDQNGLTSKHGRSQLTHHEHSQSNFEQDLGRDDDSKRRKSQSKFESGLGSDNDDKENELNGQASKDRRSQQSHHMQSQSQFESRPISNVKQETDQNGLTSKNRRSRQSHHMQSSSQFESGPVSESNERRNGQMSKDWQSQQRHFDESQSRFGSRQVSQSDKENDLNGQQSRRNRLNQHEHSQSQFESGPVSINDERKNGQQSKNRQSRLTHNSQSESQFESCQVTESDQRVHKSKDGRSRQGHHDQSQSKFDRNQVTENGKENYLSSQQSKNRRSRLTHHSQSESQFDGSQVMEHKQRVQKSKDRRSRQTHHDHSQSKFQQESDREIATDQISRRSQQTHHEHSQSKFDHEQQRQISTDDGSKRMDKDCVLDRGTFRTTLQSNDMMSTNQMFADRQPSERLGPDQDQLLRGLANVTRQLSNTIDQSLRQDEAPPIYETRDHEPLQGEETFADTRKQLNTNNESEIDQTKFSVVGGGNFGFNDNANRSDQSRDKNNYQGYSQGTAFLNRQSEKNQMNDKPVTNLQGGRKKISKSNHVSKVSQLSDGSREDKTRRNDAYYNPKVPKVKVVREVRKTLSRPVVSFDKNSINPSSLRTNEQRGSRLMHYSSNSRSSGPSDSDRTSHRYKSNVSKRVSTEGDESSRTGRRILDHAGGHMMIQSHVKERLGGTESSTSDGYAPTMQLRQVGEMRKPEQNNTLMRQIEQANNRLKASPFGIGHSLFNRGVDMTYIQSAKPDSEYNDTAERKKSIVSHQRDKSVDSQAITEDKRGQRRDHFSPGVQQAINLQLQNLRQNQQLSSRDLVQHARTEKNSNLQLNQVILPGLFNYNQGSKISNNEGAASLERNSSKGSSLQSIKFKNWAKHASNMSVENAFNQGIQEEKKMNAPTKQSLPRVIHLDNGINLNESQQEYNPRCFNLNLSMASAPADNFSRDRFKRIDHKTERKQLTKVPSFMQNILNSNQTPRVIADHSDISARDVHINKSMNVQKTNTILLEASRRSMTNKRKYPDGQVMNKILPTIPAETTESEFGNLLLAQQEKASNYDGVITDQVSIESQSRDDRNFTGATFSNVVNKIQYTDNSSRGGDDTYKKLTFDHRNLPQSYSVDNSAARDNRERVNRHQFNRGAIVITGGVATSPQTSLKRLPPSMRHREQMVGNTSARKFGYRAQGNNSVEYENNALSSTAFNMIHIKRGVRDEGSNSTVSRGTSISKRDVKDCVAENNQKKRHWRF